MPATEHEAEQATSGMMLKDLRVECRARGISPAGGREQLLMRVREHMVETGDCAIKSAGEADGAIAPAAAAAANAPADAPGFIKNNYARPDGQNCGNFVDPSGRTTSRVLAPPGGGSSICFGDDASAAAKPAAAGQLAPVAEASAAPLKIAPAAAAGIASTDKIAIGSAAPVAAPAATLANIGGGAVISEPTGTALNNYARPGGAQNTSNFLTGRNSSRVLAPPGGGSSITFG